MQDQHKATIPFTRNHIFDRNRNALKSTKTILNDIFVLLTGKPAIGKRREKRQFLAGMIAVGAATLTIGGTISNILSNQKLDKLMGQFEDINRRTSDLDNMVEALYHFRNDQYTINMKINVQLKEISKEFATMDRRIEHIYFDLEFQTIVDSHYNRLMILQEFLLDFFEGINDILHEIPSHTFFHSFQIRKIIEQFQSTENANLVYGTQEIWKYFSMIQTYIAMNQTTLTVYGEIRIPTVENIQEVYRAIKYYRFNYELDSFVKLTDTMEYLAVAGNKFSIMEGYQFADCIQQPDLLVCDESLPVLSTIRSSGCLAHVYAKNVREISKICKFQTVKRVDPIFEHLNKGIWHVAAREPLTVYLHCPQKTTIQKIEGNGFIQFSDQCSLKTENQILQKNYKHQKNITFKFVSEKNLVFNISQLWNLKASMASLEKFNSSNPLDLGFEDLVKNMDHSKFKKKMLVFHENYTLDAFMQKYVLNPTIISLIILLLVVFVFLCFKINKGQN